jgi:hypothetical protein
MKRFFTLFFALFALTAVAQENFEFKPAVVDTFFDENTVDPVGKSFVCNTGNDTLELYWRIEPVMVPLAWSPYVCDKNLCYGPGQDSCPIDLPVVLAPGECGNMDIHILPTSVIECGRYKMTVWEKGNTSNSGIIEYNYNCISSSDDVEALEDLAIFPNPAADYFQLTESLPNTRLSVTNLVGKEVLRYNIFDGGRYPIQDLSSGMYMVNILSQDNELIKSVRLKKF